MRGRYQESCIWLHFTSRAELRLLIKFYQSEKCKFEERSIFGQAKIGRKNCFHWQDGLHRISYNNIYLSHGWNRIEKVSFDMEFVHFIVQGHLRNYFVQLFPIRYRSCAAIAIMCWGMKNLKNIILLHSKRGADRCRIRDRVTKKPDVWISIPVNTPQRNQEKNMNNYDSLKIIYHQVN